MGTNKLIKSFLRDNLLLTISTIFIPILYSFILFLNDYNLDLLLYITLLTWFFTGILLFIRFRSYRRTVRKLEWLLADRDNGIDDMPRTFNQIELLYQDICQQVFTDKNRVVTETESNYKDLTDYYTLWVHQIKTPITALRLLLENSDGMNDALIELFKIEQYAQMALTYIRMDGMSNDLRLENCDLDSMIRNTIKKYSKMFIMSKLSLQYETIHASVITDEKWFTFILEQLLSNALKYTKTGNISIYYENEQLFIKDTGIGIQEEDLPRIFEKGFTGINGRNDKKASGLGLYMVKKISTKLGHRISVQSRIDEGTTFCIDLHQYVQEKE